MFTELDKKIIHEVALNNFVSDYVVEDVILSIEHSVADMISSSDVKNGVHPTIGLVNFGKFVVSEKKRQFAKKYYGKWNKDINEGETDCP